MSNEPLNIDLKGIEDKWSKTGHSICAQCGKNFDTLEDEESDDRVPLQMFRGKGKNTEMLTLCWSCAEPRMTGGYPCYGICCRCGEQTGLRTIAQLPYKGPVPHIGWGCVVCNLPADGMLAMLCDDCSEKDCLEANLKWICGDYASSPKRVAWASVKDRLVPHNHDMSFHQDECPTN